jgi:hypothetical protein
MQYTIIAALVLFIVLLLACLVVSRMKRKGLNKDIDTLAVTIGDLSYMNQLLSDELARYKGAWESQGPTLEEEIDRLTRPHVLREEEE